MGINTDFYKFLEQKLKGRYRGNITPEMKLYKDFGLYGDDVDEFLTSFVQQFGIDAKGFNFKEHFYLEGDFTFISKLFGNTKKDLSIRELEQAIESKKLK